ncbi:MAG TPA: hypothetical protein VJ302_32065 [Blastocatellia bacterium]|nr:hypothetical protein [Blastocatellia bacterium]
MELINAALIGPILAMLLSMTAQDLTNTPKPPPAPASNSWQVLITSSGGFHGRGDGSISIDSDGNVTVYNLDKSCRLQLPAESFRELERSMVDWVLSAELALPPAATSEIACCDLIKYSVSVKVGAPGPEEKAYSASWFQNLDGGLPQSLRTVCRTALQLRQSLLTDCQPSN